MNTVKISRRWQVLIPREARESLQLRPGQKIRVFVHNGLLELVPVRPMREMRGFLRGVDTAIEREEDRL